MSKSPGAGANRPARAHRTIRRSVRRALVWLLFTLLERLLPVDRRVWCFAAWTRHWHTLDNPRGVFERVKNDPAILKVVLTRTELPRDYPRDGVNVRFVPAESIAGMYYVARSAVLVLGFRLYAMCSYGRLITRKHQVVQVWHGIPLKKIGHLFPGEDWHDETPRYAATVSSSPADQEIMRQAFSPLPPARVWVTGLPRNDFIVGPEAALPPDYLDMLGALREQLRGRRLVLYAPTWRDVPGDHYAFSAAEVSALARILAAQHAVLGVRGHSNVQGNAAYNADYGSPGFLNLNDLPDVNLALRLTDVLITDYSSIYIDFLLTDRPIVHFTYDLAKYRSGRGFLYEAEEVFAAPPALDFEQLAARLTEALSNPAGHAARRAEVRNLFHLHPAESGQAVADHIRSLTQLPRSS